MLTEKERTAATRLARSTNSILSNSLQQEICKLIEKSDEQQRRADDDRRKVAQQNQRARRSVF